MFCLICPQCKYSFVAIMYSKFFSCFILDDITQPVRILGGSYKWIIFPRQSYLTEELVPLLKWVPAPNSGLVYPWFFRFQPLYTGKKPVVTRFASGLLFVCFIPQQQSCVYSSMLCQWWSLITNTSISSIWIKISINCNNFLNVCSYYRQWQLPNNLGINNSNSNGSQIDRYTIFSKQVNLASKEGHNLVILTGDNIKSIEDNSNSSYYRNMELKSIKDNLINKDSLTIHNKDLTFFWKDIKSCIDHIMSNCPQMFKLICLLQITDILIILII